ncbi:MAG: phosphotransferase enzyme family protein [Chloroflexota bacterium]
MRDNSQRHNPHHRPSLSDPDVRRLAAEIAPGSAAVDLGGTMSLNVGLQSAGLVLRVHRPFVSRPRLIALQHVRQGLAERGLIVPVPVPWRGATVFRCASRWAELETYVPGERPEPLAESYTWMFRAMGALHRTLATLHLTVPRPVVATYGPPSTLLRWLPVTESAIRGDPDASGTARRLRELIRRLRSQWVTAAELPVQLIHGDVRLGNVRRTPEGETVYLDFGFLAHRPRIHELAYSLAWMVLRPDSRGTAEGFAWETVPQLVRAYEDTAQTALTAGERRALAPHVAAVPLYLAALAGFVSDPVAHLRNEARLAFLRIGEWILAHPDAVLG